MRWTTMILAAVAMAMTACSGETGTNSEDVTTTETAITEPTQQTDTTAGSASATTAAADDGGAESPDITAVDPCALLTDEEVASILESPTEGAEEDLGWDGACVWESVDDDEILTSLSVELAELGEFAEEELQNWRENTTVIEDPVPVGDDAFLALHGIEGSSIIVRDETLLVFVSTTVEGHEETIKGLGSAVLERLG